MDYPGLYGYAEFGGDACVGVYVIGSGDSELGDVVAS